MELSPLLNHIKQMADQLHKEAGLSVEAAYERAIAATFRLAAEEQVISPFEARVIAELRSVGRGGEPVSSAELAVRLGLNSRYAMSRCLRRLERRGLVYRPDGMRSGWMAG